MATATILKRKMRSGRIHYYVCRYEGQTRRMESFKCDFAGAKRRLNDIEAEAAAEKAGRSLVGSSDSSRLPCPTFSEFAEVYLRVKNIQPPTYRF